MNLEIILDEWNKFRQPLADLLKSKKLLLTPNQLDLLTPVALPSSSNEEIRNAYFSSVRKIGRHYQAPVFATIKIAFYKNVSWFIYSKFHLLEWQEFLLRECRIKLPTETFSPHKLASQVIEKEIKFWVKPKEKAQFEFIKVISGDKAVGYKAINEVLPFKEIR